MGMRELDTQHSRGTEAHRRQTAGRDERARHGDRKLLRDAVLVPADVGDDESVGGDGASQIALDPLGPHRELIRRPLMLVVRHEFPAPSRDVLWKLPRLRGLTPARSLGEHGERGLRIGDHAELGRIIPADLRRVRVDVHQARRRNRERERGSHELSWLPPDVCRLRGSDRHGGMPGSKSVSAKARLAEQQRVVSCRQPFPISV